MEDDEIYKLKKYIEILEETHDINMEMNEIQELIIDDRFIRISVHLAMSVAVMTVISLFFRLTYSSPEPFSGVFFTIMKLFGIGSFIDLFIHCVRFFMLKIKFDEISITALFNAIVSAPIFFFIGSSLS